MMQYTVHLHKPDGRTISYPTTLLRHTPDHILLHARWTLPPVDLGMLCFEPQDVLLEYFYPTRWYNVFALYTPTGTLKVGIATLLAQPACTPPLSRAMTCCSIWWCCQSHARCTCSMRRSTPRGA